jgi:predicted AAA+ superfamily ATPase
MRLIPRQIRPQLLNALGEARVVCLLGPRQAGKSTLVRDIAANELRERIAAVPLAALWQG